MNAERELVRWSHGGETWRVVAVAGTKRMDRLASGGWVIWGGAIRPALALIGHVFGDRSSDVEVVGTEARTA